MRLRKFQKAPPIRLQRFAQRWVPVSTGFFLRATVCVIAATLLISCSENEKPLNARAGRIPPEQLNQLLRDRYAASQDIGQQLEKAGGRLQLSIDLSYCKFTDDDLKRLDLPDYLTHLNLEATAISDAGVSHLLEAKHLEQLDLGRTEVTEECLETLRKLPALKQVDLNGTAVSPAEQLEMVRFLRSRHSSKDKRSPTTP